jgi:hypothetical protein
MIYLAIGENLPGFIDNETKGLLYTNTNKTYSKVEDTNQMSNEI